MIPGSKNILVASRCLFPEGDPASVRLACMARALQDAGYHPLVVSAAAREREEDRQQDGSFRYQGIRYAAIDEAGVTARHPIGKICDYLRLGAETANWVRRQDLANCAAFVSVGGYAHFHLRLFRYMQARGIPCVTDCLDWFGPRQSSGFVRFPQWINTELTMRRLNVQAGHVIAISRFFEDYYASRGCRVVRVPPLVDLKDPRWPQVVPHRPAGSPLRLVYAGTPGCKDQLRPVVVGILQLVAKGVDIVLELIGPSRSELARHMGRDALAMDSLDTRLIFHGRLPAVEVPRRLAEADFSVLLRPKARYSEAGFPTKVAESLASGVPVICNDTSNISEYVRDGSEGFLIAGNATDDFVQGIHRVWSQGPAVWAGMRQAARERARQCFDFRGYIQPLDDFFSDLTRTDATTQAAA